MAIVLASATGNFGNDGATSAVITKPTGKWTNGNLLILGGTFDANAVPAINAAFTQLNNDAVNSFSYDGDRVAASEPASYTIAGGSGEISLAALILEYSGQASVSPINVHSVNSGTGKTITFTGVTTTVAGCQIIALLSCTIFGDPGTFTTPAGFTLQETQNGQGTVSHNNSYIIAWDINQAAAGAITPGSITVTSAATAANVVWAAYTIAIAPGAAGNPQLSANITLGALQLSATLKAIDKLSASINLGALTANQVLKAIDKLQANISLGALLQTANIKAIDKLQANVSLASLIQNATLIQNRTLQSSVSLAALLQAATFHNTAGPLSHANMLPLYRRRGRR